MKALMTLPHMDGHVPICGTRIRVTMIAQGVRRLAIATPAGLMVITGTTLAALLGTGPVARSTTHLTAYVGLSASATRRLI